eukprot:m.37458 g.37458  ORF g.37458 m.37458 type:complete len:180 (-) comp14563_c0_seq1:1075-1614(-)
MEVISYLKMRVCDGQIWWALLLNTVWSEKIKWTIAGCVCLCEGSCCKVPHPDAKYIATALNTSQRKDKRQGGPTIIKNAVSVESNISAMRLFGRRSDSPLSSHCRKAVDAAETGVGAGVLRSALPSSPPSPLNMLAPRPLIKASMGKLLSAERLDAMYCLQLSCQSPKGGRVSHPTLNA